MSVKKSFVLFLFSVVAFSFSLLSCDLFNSFSDDYNPVSQFYLNTNTLTVEAGFFQPITITCLPESEQSGLDISWSYDNDIIELVPDNFSVTVYGKKPGTTTLKASIRDHTSSCIVTVTGSPLSAVVTPYVYANTAFVSLTPNGEQFRIAASLAGGTPNDVSGFSFEAEHSGVVGIVSEGNVAWLQGISSGMTRVTVRHSRSSFPYTFIVSCSDSNITVPYITTESNVITVNKTLTKETSFSVSMVNSHSFIYDSDYSFAILDHNYNEGNDLPVSISANGKDCIITPLKSGECFIRVSHKSSDVYYPLDVLVIVYEQIENVYIEIPEPIVYVHGASAATFSVALANLPPEVTPNFSDFRWTFPDNVGQIVDYTIYGGGSFGTGNSLWLSGKKTGSFPVSIEHPLAPLKRTFYVVVKNITGEAIDASTYITTTQNYVLSSASADPVTIGVTIYNLEPGEENLLNWSAAHNPQDGSANPVVEYVAATGNYSAAGRARSLYVPITSGYLTISPIREGSAVISVSHPKAFYETKILITVLAANAQIDEKPFSLSIGYPHITLVNGESSTAVSVSLNGETVRAADEADISWSSSDPAILSVSGSGTQAYLSAHGSGFSRNTITVTHPKALQPLIITVVCGDSQEQIDNAKYILSMNYSYVIEKDQTVFLSAFIQNREEEDTLLWNVTSGLNTIISIAQIDPQVISVTGLSNGLASVTASIAHNSDTNTAATFHILVSSNAAPPSQAAYLSTPDNVVVLAPTEEKSVTVTSVNVPLDNLVSWSDYDDSLIDLIPNNHTAVIRAKGKTGDTAVTVSHPKSVNSIVIHVRVGNRYIYENTDVAYISTPADTVVLTAGGHDHQFYAFLAHTEKSDISTNGFSFSISQPSVASFKHEPSTNEITIKPVAPGQAVLTVSHQNAPDKEVLVIVERSSGDSSLTPYITSKQNIVTVVSGETAVISASLVNALSYNNSEWRWASSVNSSVSIVANNGPTAIIRGYNPGQSVISVSHDKAAHPLTITVLCIDSAISASQTWINTNASIINLKVNASQTITAEMTGGSPSDNNAFNFALSDQSVIFINQSGNSAYVRSLKPGTATITVTNTMYPAANPGNKKTILVIVEPSADEDTYITVDKNTVHMTPESTAPVIINASLTGPNVSATDQTNFTWWADDYSVVYLDSVANTATVMPTGKTAVTTIHVKHPKSAYSLDIIVIISKYTQFAFAETSKSVPKGGTAFIPMRVPPQSGAFKIEYSSSNPAVCEIVGSNSTALIAGIAHGQTTVSAALKVNNQTVSTSELAVIVGYVSPNANAITIANPIVNMELGQQQTLKALLSGPDISEQDKYTITWESDNPSIASLLATEHGLTKGPEALVTATGPGETFIKVSHDKVRYEVSSLHPQAEKIIEHILIVVPQQNEKIITLNQTAIIMLKDDPDIKVSATIANGTQADYANITWSAPRVSGQNIISVRGSGKDCNIHPLNIGTTTLRAQLPNGIYADCIVAVQSSAAIKLSTNAVHLNPGYSQTVSYSVSPENALVQWNSIVNGSVSASEYFSFDVDTTAKTITVTAQKIGSGYIQGIMLSGGSGSNTARLNVFVEYNYSFDLDTNGPITREPFPGTIIEIPYRCYPPDLSIELETVSSSYAKSVSLYTITHNAADGTGVIKLEALAEKDNIILYAKASNPKDPASVQNPIRRMITLNLVYNNITVTPIFYTQTGAFSGFKQNANSTWNLTLGDGEDVLFYFDIDQKNADVTPYAITYMSTGPVHPDGHNTNKISYGWDTQTDPSTGNRLYRIRHTEDVIGDGHYRITRDLSYRDISITESYTHTGSGSSGQQILVFPDPDDPDNYYYDYINHDYNENYGTKTNVIKGPSILDPKLGQGFIALKSTTYNFATDTPPIYQMTASNPVFDRILKELSFYNFNFTYGDKTHENQYRFRYSYDPDTPNSFLSYDFYKQKLYETKTTTNPSHTITSELLLTEYVGAVYTNRSFYTSFLPLIKDKEGLIKINIGGSQKLRLYQEGTPLNWEVYNSYNLINTYQFTIHYEPCTPYFIPKAEFESNLNYYLPATSLSGISYSEQKLHKYAEKASPDTIKTSATGQLVIEYRRLNKDEKKFIMVNVDVRECDAFSRYP